MVDSWLKWDPERYVCLVRDPGRTGRGVFCVPSLGGLVEGVSMGAQIEAQIKGVLLATVYCFAISWVILRVINAVITLRANESVEEMGQDLAEHN